MAQNHWTAQPSLGKLKKTTKCKEALLTHTILEVQKLATHMNVGTRCHQYAALARNPVAEVMELRGAAPCQTWTLEKMRPSTREASGNSEVFTYAEILSWDPGAPTRNCHKGLTLREVECFAGPRRSWRAV